MTATTELYDALKVAHQYVIVAVFDGRDGKLGKTPETNANLLKMAERDLQRIDAALALHEATP